MLLVMEPSVNVSLVQIHTHSKLIFQAVIYVRHLLDVLLAQLKLVNAQLVLLLEKLLL